jgi:hypothetical protein
MSVRFDPARRSPDAAIELSGSCGVEDAETLQRHLLALPSSAVEWGTCEQLHSAVLQVLLAANPRMRGLPAVPFLRNHIRPLLRSMG